MRITARALLLWVGLSAVVFPASAQPVPEQREDAGKVRPLLAVLQDLAAGAPVDLRVDPAVADREVDLGTPASGFEMAIKEALLASGVDFVMAWRNGRLQVRAGDLRAAVEVPSGPRQAPAAEAREPQAVGDQEALRAIDAEPAQLRGSDGTPQEGDGGTGVDGPGTVTGQELVKLLATPPGVGRIGSPGVIELPFTDATGQPVRMVRPTTPRTAVELPFTDATGQPVVQPLAPRSPGVIELPFPDANGQPIRLVVPAGAVSPRRPGDR